MNALLTNVCTQYNCNVCKLVLWLPAKRFVWHFVKKITLKWQSVMCDSHVICLVCFQACNAWLRCNPEVAHWPLKNGALHIVDDKKVSHFYSLVLAILYFFIPSGIALFQVFSFWSIWLYSKLKYFHLVRSIRQLTLWRFNNPTLRSSITVCCVAHLN